MEKLKNGVRCHVSVDWAPELKQRRCEIISYRDDGTYKVLWKGNKAFLNQNPENKYGTIFARDELVLIP